MYLAFLRLVGTTVLWVPAWAVPMALFPNPWVIATASTSTGCFVLVLSWSALDQTIEIGDAHVRGRKGPFVRRIEANDLVAITRGRLRPWFALPVFMTATGRPYKNAAVLAAFREPEICADLRSFADRTDIPFTVRVEERMGYWHWVEPAADVDAPESGYGQRHGRLWGPSFGWSLARMARRGGA